MNRKALILLLPSICAFLLCSCERTDKCDHDFTHFDAKEATFYVDGNKEYYHCEKCNKFFDENKNEIAGDSIKVRLPLFETLNRENPIKLYGKNIDLIYDNNKTTQILANADALINKIDGGTRYTDTEAQKQINEVLNYLDNEVIQEYYKSLVLADALGTTEAYEIKDEIFNAYYKLEEKYYDIYVALAKDGTYRNKFFKNKTDEEIQDFIKKHSHSGGGGGGSSEPSTEQKIENLLNKFGAGKIDRYTAYHDYVALANQLASEHSCANYLEYAYKQYSREYTVSQTMTLSEYATTYITPLARSIRAKLATAKEDNEIAYQSSKLENKFFGQNIDLLRAYALSMDESYKTNFETMFQDGDYFFSDVANTNAGAYTATSPTLGQYIFLGRNYQDLMSFVHEFGHYNSMITFGNIGSLDLSETLSRGNEFVFLAFLNGNNLLSENLTKTFIYARLAKTLNTILLGFAVNEFENYAYQGTFDQASLEAKWLELVDKYGASLTRDKLEYLYEVILNYRGYYISYAVSAMAALQVFTKALANFEGGVASYNSLCKKDSEDEKFKKSLQNAGLNNVLEEKAFSDLSELNNI